MMLQFDIKTMFIGNTLPYELCVKPKRDSFTIAALQEDDINLFPSDV